MNAYKITFANGDNIKTGFNGDLSEATRYYIGRWFNLSSGADGEPEDNMQKGIKIEVIK